MNDQDIATRGIFISCPDSFSGKRTQTYSQR